MDKTTILKCDSNVAIIDMSDGLVIQQNKMIHTLNSTGAEVLDLCDGKHTLQMIVNEMAKRYPGEDVENGIMNFLNQACESELIEIWP